MRKYISISLLIMCLFNSCQDIEEGNIGSVVTGTFRMFIENKNGDDLLNPGLEEFLDVDELDLYNEDFDGNYILYRYRNLDRPRGVELRLDETSGKYYIIIDFDYKKIGKINYHAILDWNGQVENDSILGKMNQVYIDQLYINGELKYDWEESNHNNPQVTIIK